ncbi:MAG TPA: nodulation protein NfeD [Clostridia bacterium]|nr:nodulation protein NfeD [Clostridia bacterium]
MGATEVGLITIDGAIGPATADYIDRATKVAGEKRFQCLILQLDTPGGMLDSTKEIVQTFYQSPVPVVVYVAPSGANAGSAGVFITLAADVAAMAPNTSIGAAHPVSIGAGGEQQTDDVMKQKLENFASSYIEAIAQKRGRNAEWAKAAVVKSESITSEKALELDVIDLIAKDLPDLLNQIHQRKINEQTLNTAGAKIVPVPMVMRERVFQLLARPEIMMILMLVAIYGIIGELSNPGAILPGVTGAIALILVLYMSAILPINVAGLALVALAVALFVADIFAPTHGVLTFGGIAAFFLGMVMLFNKAEPGFRLSLAYIIPATLLTAGFFVFVIGAGLRAQRRPVRAGRETLLGTIVPAILPIDSRSGKVFVEGEYWNALSDTFIPEGDPVEITAVEGLTLRVRPARTGATTGQITT